MQESHKAYSTGSRGSTGLGAVGFVVGILIFIVSCFAARWAGDAAAYASFVGILLTMMSLAFG